MLLSYFLPTGIRIPSNALTRKRKKVMITLFGPYGHFKSDLIEISSILRTEYGYIDCKLVQERHYKPTAKDRNILKEL
jgi:hypothetical protein